MNSQTPPPRIYKMSLDLRQGENVKKYITSIGLTYKDSPELFEIVNAQSDLRAAKGEFIPAKVILTEMVKAYNIPKMSPQEERSISLAIKGTATVKFHSARLEVDGRKFIVVHVGE